MPDLIADAFDCLGEEMSDWLDPRAGRPALPRRSSPTARCSTSTPTSTRCPRRSSGSSAPRRPRATAATSTSSSKLYQYEMNDFIDRNIDSPLDLLTPDLAKLVALGGFRRLAPKVRQYLKDPRTERIYSFQAMYAGVSPYDALAIYAVIAYMDSVAGVFFPKGGMHAVPPPWLPRPRSTGSSSATAPRSRRSRPSATAPSPSSPRTATGSPPTPWCSTPTCPSPTATCWAASPGRSGDSTTPPPASCCSPGRRRSTARSGTTTSTSAGRGRACSTS